MDPFRHSLPSWRQALGTALRGLQSWTARQVLVAAAAAVAFGAALGVVTVLIPNAWFVREIPPVWWNYPVWLLTSLLSGMLVATYIRSGPGTAAADDAESADSLGQRRTSRLGVAGGMLAWFAVGCPVCNKLALLALGYSGAITWFAPVQPYLATGALVLTSIALVSRLRGQVACPVSGQSAETVVR